MPSRSSSRSSSSSSGHSHNTSAKAASRLGLASLINWFQSETQSRPEPNERTGLLHRHQRSKPHADPKTRSWVWGTLAILTALLLTLLLAFPSHLPAFFCDLLGILPQDPMLAALSILKRAPIIDGHIDLPILVRSAYSNNVSAVDLTTQLAGHVDIPRLKLGQVGGFFWSVYVDCPNPGDDDSDFLNPTWRVRDTLEQIDVARLLIAKYPHTFKLALGSSDIKGAISQGKIASLLGVEGGHQLGNSIAVLRQYHALGVRYVTLTHTCHNAFADSAGYLIPKEPLYGGLSEFGLRLIEEMNRLGVLVDLSHTSDATAMQALNVSKAPVIWSHSSARTVHNVARNVPDSVLQLLGTEPDKKDGVVMVNFAPQFISNPENATVQAVADHVEHIARTAGRKHVGIGSDFDGIGSTPTGLEDVSKYPALIAELYSRGWSKHDLAGFTGANLLRVLEGAEAVSSALQNTAPIFNIYPKRSDL